MVLCLVVYALSNPATIITSTKNSTAQAISLDRFLFTSWLMGPFDFELSGYFFIDFCQNCLSEANF